MKTTLSGCVLLLFFGIACNQEKKNERVDTTYLPGSIQATLTLPSGETKTIDSSQTGALTTLRNFKLLTPRGSEYSFTLGKTRLYLNTASTISMDTKKHNKTITINEGELYFEVPNDDSNEVQIVVRDWVIAPQRGKFNVESYNPDEINICCLDGGLLITGKKRKIELKPDQILTIKNGLYNIKVGVEGAIAWRRGSIHGPQLPSILDQISRWYDIDIVYNAKLPASELEGDIDRNMTIEEVVKLLTAATGINAELDKKNRKLVIN